MKKLHTFESFVNESINFDFPKTLTFTKEVWHVGMRQNFGPGLGSSKNYHDYEWTDKENKYNSTDFIGAGVVMMLEPKSVEPEYAEYRPKGGGESSIRGFLPKDIEAFRALKAIKE